MTVIANPTEGRVKQSLCMPTPRRIAARVITKRDNLRGLLCRKNDPLLIDDCRGAQ